MMKKITNLSFLVCILLLAECKETQTNQCGTNNKLDLSEIKNLSVYREAKSVKIGSFKPTRHGGDLQLPLKDNQVDQSGFFELSTLDQNDSDELFSVLVNYNFNPENTDSVTRTVVFCYIPRNAILFLDNRENVIGYIELCFECYGYKKFPMSLNVGEFCDKKFEAIKEIFLQNGIEYGLTDLGDDDQLANLLKQISKSPNNPILLLSLAKLRMDSGNFEDAILQLDKTIALDSSYQQAYFLRGHCKLATKDFLGAILDFDTVISRDSTVIQAYHERALAMIGLFEAGRDSQLPKRICLDLNVVRETGDTTVVSIQKKYCEDMR